MHKNFRQFDVKKVEVKIEFLLFIYIEIKSVKLALIIHLIIPYLCERRGMVSPMFHFFVCHIKIRMPRAVAHAMTENNVKVRILR